MRHIDSILNHEDELKWSIHMRVNKWDFSFCHKLKWGWVSERADSKNTLKIKQSKNDTHQSLGGRSKNILKSLLRHSELATNFQPLVLLGVCWCHRCDTHKGTGSCWYAPGPGSCEFLFWVEAWLGKSPKWPFPQLDEVLARGQKICIDIVEENQDCQGGISGLVLDCCRHYSWMWRY